MRNNAHFYKFIRIPWTEYHIHTEIKGPFQQSKSWFPIKVWTFGWGTEIFSSWQPVFTHTGFHCPQIHNNTCTNVGTTGCCTSVHGNISSLDIHMNPFLVVQSFPSPYMEHVNVYTQKLYNKNKYNLKYTKHRRMGSIQCIHNFWSWPVLGWKRRQELWVSSEHLFFEVDHWPNDLIILCYYSAAWPHLRL